LTWKKCKNKPRNLERKTSWRFLQMDNLELTSKNPIQVSFESDLEGAFLVVALAVMKTYAPSATNRPCSSQASATIASGYNCDFSFSFPITFSFGLIPGAQLIGTLFFYERVRCAFRITRGNQSNACARTVNVRNV
jgi:hypothetical protein